MIYAISDIHGCLEALKEKLALVDLSGESKIIFLGDYIDYGPESGQTLRYIYEYQQKHGPEKVIVLKGNHEAMLLEWIDEFSQELSPGLEDSAFDSWLKTDSQQSYKTLRTLIAEAQLARLMETEKEASFARLNAEAVKMVLAENGDLIEWMRTFASFYETDKQIFVHAGVDEEAGEYWQWGATDEMYLWKFPATFGKFCKTVIAGHLGTCEIARKETFHEIYYDGASHYYIDGTVYNNGKLLLLGFNEADGQYCQIEKHGRFPIASRGR